MTALDRLHAVLVSGHRPSPHRFNEAVRELDDALATLLAPMPAPVFRYVFDLIHMRSMTVSLRDSYETSEDTAREIIQRVAQHLASHVDVPQGAETPQPVTCDNCGRVPQRYVIVGDRRYCMPCAEELGIRPKGRI